MTTTREEWLEQAMRELNERAFKRAGFPAPEHAKVSCGFTGRGKSNTTHGQCWARSASANGVNEIFVAPIIDDPFNAVDVLAHEMVHAVLDCRGGHGWMFRRVALAVGLQGRMKSATAGPELAEIIREIVSELGPYPHARLDFEQRTKQSTRLIKCWCESCGYVARVSAKWLDDAGEPICPTDWAPMQSAHIRTPRPDPNVIRLPETATVTDEELEQAVKRARRKMQRAHPDKGGTDEKFRAAREEFERAVEALERRKRERMQ